MCSSERKHPSGKPRAFVKRQSDTDNWKNRLVLVFSESCSRDNFGNLLMRDVLLFPSATRTTCRKEYR